MDTRLLYLVYCCLCVAAIFLPQYFWPSGPGDGACVPWRPAAFNYICVWSILCALLTISLTTATTTMKNGARAFHDTRETYVKLGLYAGILSCIVAWSPSYHNNKADGVTVFLWMLLLVLPLVVLLGRDTRDDDSTIALATMSPLVVWVIFQMCVNIQEVNTKIT